MPYSYSLNCGQYVLTADGAPVGPCLDEVCLALDSQEGTLHKHGAPDKVLAWLEKTQSSLRAAGCDEMAQNLVAITGRFPLEQLNRCLDTLTYAGTLYGQALSGRLEQQELPPPKTAPQRRAKP